MLILSTCLFDATLGAPPQELPCVDVHLASGNRLVTTTFPGDTDPVLLKPLHIIYALKYDLQTGTRPTGDPILAICPQNMKAWGLDGIKKPPISTLQSVL
jgi:hypothetical protein